MALMIPAVTVPASSCRSGLPIGIVLSLGNRENPQEMGANLFKHLRKFDFLGIEVVYSETVAETGEGMAIMNRLKKAAGYQIIQVV